MGVESLHVTKPLFMMNGPVVLHKTTMTATPLYLSVFTTLPTGLIIRQSLLTTPVRLSKLVYMCDSVTGKLIIHNSFRCLFPVPLARSKENMDAI